MLGTEASPNEPLELIVKDEEVTLREQIAEVPICWRGTPRRNWVFIGKCAMPGSEHLIPFRN